jgi:hypothetical protein
MNTTIKIKALVLILAITNLPFAVAGNEFDGSYDVKLICGKNLVGDAGFTLDKKILIVNDRIKDLTEQPKPTIMALTGEVKGAEINALGSWQSQNGKENYQAKLSGKVLSKELIVATGGFFNNGEKRRDCSISFTKTVNSNQSARVTSPPVMFPPANGFPERSAAIGNVQVPSNTNLARGLNQQPVQVTTNQIDLQKKTNPNEVWISFNPSITVQQRQFCRIIENFRTENAIALQTNNQIKVNQTFKNLVQSLVSLLPDGKFQGWVMRTVYVSQASNGDAEVLLELPCNVFVGSNACDSNPNNFYGTAPENSRIYTELAKMTVGDFAITSGKFVYSDENAFDKNRSVASFGYMKTANHCRAKTIASNSDFFGLSLETMSTIK